MDANGIEYKIPTKTEYSIDNIPFNKTGIYKPDFYLPEKDLYIEIKGTMSLWTVNKLMYLLKKRLPENFCILQMSDEAWISEGFKDVTLSSIKKKTDRATEIQFSEIKEMSSQDLHDLSLKRLEDYIKTNKDEFNS